MEEQLINFSTAKLAKEKGFNIPCINMYYTEEFFEGEIIGELYQTDSGYSNDKFDGSASAPTQSLLQKWLREVHNIHIEIRVGIRQNNLYKSEAFTICGDLKHNSKISEYLSPYEEVLEIALQNGLTLIKS